MLFDDNPQSGGEGYTILQIIGWIIVILWLFDSFVKLFNWLGFQVGGC